MKPFPLSVGQRFGRLALIEMVRASRGGDYWRCACDCGGAATVRADHLRSGKTLSCKCYKVERAAAANTKHGASETAEFKTWMKMIGRCTCPTDAAFGDYGGRGITVASEWLCDFPRFLADMGRRPSPQHTLDRRDNDGPYSRQNCRWATRKEQARNRRSNRIVEYRGERMCLAAAAEMAGLDLRQVVNRLRHGWSEERALSEPPRCR